MLDRSKKGPTGSASGLTGVGPASLVGDVNRATPRYLVLARLIYEGIQHGTYPVGSLLPTELDLSIQHKVSRQTVRQAIGQLRQQGLVSARKGVGTRIEAKDAPKVFTYSTLSADDLVEVAEGSEMSIRTSEFIMARGRLATDLGCRPKHRWLHLAGPRSVDGEARLLAWVDVYVDGRLAKGLAVPKKLRAALFMLLERQSGETLREIRQEIRAVVLDDEQARNLVATPGAAALEITRKYYGTGRRLIMVSVNVLPADRFFYSVAITCD